MRKIDWDQALSDEDKAFARQAGFALVEDRIAANEARFASEPSMESTEDEPPVPGEDPPVNEEPPVPEDEGDDCDDWKVAELRTEAAERKIDGMSNAKKDDVIAALRDWDSKQNA